MRLELPPHDLSPRFWPQASRAGWGLQVTLPRRLTSRPTPVLYRHLGAEHSTFQPCNDRDDAWRTPAGVLTLSCRTSIWKGGGQPCCKGRHYEPSRRPSRNPVAGEELVGRNNVSPICPKGRLTLCRRCWQGDNNIGLREVVSLEQKGVFECL